jgi:predicted nucleic acid-binding Zn ribbon protein
MTWDLNQHHLPENAGEYAEGLSKIMDRIPDGWGRWISHGKGWYKLVCDTDEMLSFIDPDYEIHQVKEKFGTLRYYYASKLPWGSTQEKIMEAIVRHAEDLSAVTCEECGKAQYGTLDNIDSTVKLRAHGWYRTLCDTHALEQGCPIEETEEE